MSRHERFSVPVVGGSSLLVMFAVLCLTIFALLGLSTVQADQRLSQASADSIFDYYRGDLQAEQILAQLRRGEVPAGVCVQDHLYSYSCPVSQTKRLDVTVEECEGTWHVLRWQVVSLVEWEVDERLDVWDGDLAY